MRTRLLHLDNLKVVLIGLIIVLHAVLGYVGLVVAWTYADVRETTLHPVVEMVLIVVLSPFAVYVFAVQPTLVYAVAHPFGAAPGSWRQEYLAEGGRVDTGPLWFVGVLLVYSLGYAAWRRLRRPRRAATRPPTLRTLVLAALAVAPASFVVRLVYPYGGESGITDLNFWEWPACIAVFVIGIRAARSGWVHAVPADLVRRSRLVTATGVVAMTVLLYVAGSRDAVEAVLGGWTWYAAAFACIEAVLVVFGPVWLLDLARRRLDRPLPWGEQLGRSAYGAFMLQTFFLLGLAVALRPVPFPAELKAVLVATGAVTASFGAAWLLISRVPGVSRIL